MFSGKFSQKQRARSYRQMFVAKWQAFITENFDSAEEVGAIFGVDASTARGWIDGEHAPSGFAVGYAYQHYPEQAAAHLREPK